MKAGVESSEYDKKPEMKRAAEMENQDALSISHPSRDGKADPAGSQVVNCNGKEEVEEEEELTPQMDVMDEKKSVMTEDSVADKLVQDKGEDEKTQPFTAVRPATMSTLGEKGTKNQLTVFYDGRVIVFESIPAEKVQEIMLIATAAATTSVKAAENSNTGSQLPFVPPAPTSFPSPQRSGALAALQALRLPSQKSSLYQIQEFPIARRHSLQRFLEKRRDRLATKCPYASPSTKIDDSLDKNLEDSDSPDSVNFKQSEEEFEPIIAAS